MRSGCLSSKLTQCDFRYFLLAKASHETSPDTEDGKIDSTSRW